MICRCSLAIAIFGLCFVLPCVSQQKCEPLAVSLCQGLSYNYTIFPNILGHGTQREAAIEVNQYYPWVRAECSKDLVFFLCAVYAPVCTVAGIPFPPCRSICIRARDDCKELMQELGFSWPADLSCDRFPKYGEKICVGESPTPTPKREPERFLIFANRRDICRVQLNLTAHQTVILNQISVVGIDFDFDTGFIYWTDSHLGYLQRAPLNNSRNSQLVIRGLSSPEGLAVDWVNKKLYWTDTGTDIIGVADFDGRNRMVLVKTGLQEPRAIAVHPMAGYVFWSDWGRQAKIEKCGMDGNHASRQVLIDRDIVWPNGLTLDYSSERVWWTDARRGTIESSDLSGLDRKVTLRSWHIRGAFGIAVFQDFVYLTKFRNGRRILKIEKATGKGWARKVSHLYSPRGIVVYDRKRQPVPQGGNPCQPTAESQSCSHICLLAPRHLYPDGYTCHCPVGFSLLEDRKTCNTTDAFKCKEDTCSNGGTCIERNGTHPICRRCVMGKWKCDGFTDCPDNLGDTGCTKCANNEFKCESSLNPTCIPVSWKCDGEDDCKDDSDEFNCTLPECKTDQFLCNTSRKCIPGSWRCDGDFDCPDKADESGCPTPSACKRSQFRCGDGTCVQQNWRCDGELDCPDKSDEYGCVTASMCKSSEFQCEEGTCANQNSRCDGKIDCPDKSDESGCSTPSLCTSNQFHCEDGSSCILSNWRCDGEPDCPDNSDEVGCPTVQVSTCSTREFQCDDGTCIHKEWRCDGDSDCSDNSDELNCSSSCAVYAEFQCATGECIQRARKCNGVADCVDQSDEIDCYDSFCGSNKYVCGNGRCIDLDKRCDGMNDCLNGSDEHDCDIESCQIHGGCSQFCSVGENLYKCYCAPGYMLNQDNKTCEAEGNDGFLLFSNFYDIRRVTFLPFTYEIAVKDQKGATGLDFDFEQQNVFWTDIQTNTIQRAPLRNTSAVDVIVDDGLDTPEGISVDWINRKLYWTDSNARQIEVSDLDGKKRLPLVTSRLKNPRAIAVHPFVGYMFWTDWGSEPPKIEKCGMNGKNTTRQVIVEKNLGWPNGLAIDYTLNRIWWTDAKRDTIESADLNGHHRRIVLKSTDSVKHPFGVSVFQDNMYWTDWNDRNVFRANKFTGEGVVALARNMQRMMDVVVFHRQRQPPGVNPCNRTIESGGCSHICLLAPVEFFPDGFSCHCPHGATLLSDQRSCNSTELPAKTGA